MGFSRAREAQGVQGSGSNGMWVGSPSRPPDSRRNMPTRTAVGVSPFAALLNWSRAGCTILDMARSISLADVLSLSVAERIQLVEEIWDSIAACPDALDLSDAQRRALDTRLEAYRQNPAAGAPWHEVHARILRTR